MRIAALDLGSNSFHLVVAEVRPDGTFTPTVREKEMLRLGEVVTSTGIITDQAADAAIASVRCAMGRVVPSGPKSGSALPPRALASRRRG